MLKATTFFTSFVFFLLNVPEKQVILKIIAHVSAFYFKFSRIPLRGDVISTPALTPFSIQASVGQFDEINLVAN